MRTILLVFYYTYSVQLIGGYSNNANPRVTTPLGDIEGSLIQSLLGKSIYAFRGIRYAKPPVGELRFQPPVPVENWGGVYNATNDGPMCPQPALKSISEDCLSLNIYTTKLPSSRYNPKRPVLFFIHPGGFFCMTSASNLFGPQYLLDRNIVLVTVNYRLGSLVSFMSTGDKWAPGNNGLKDQALAMKFVKHNIASFGGDPNLVTIVGCSAGAESVTAHLVSPMSKGLFHRAIVMSGSSFNQSPMGNHQFNLAQKQARLVGCPDDTSENIITCLKTKSAEEIGNSLSGFLEYGIDPAIIWNPVIELDFGQERFLTEHPISSVLKGKFQKVPVMTGITTEEMSNRAINVFESKKLLLEMDKEFGRVAPIAFLYERNTTRSWYISQELRKEFLGMGPLTVSAFKGVGYLYADGIVGFGVNRGAKLLSSKNTEHTYYYKFSYKGRYSNAMLPNTGTVPYGVVHQDDLMYLFYMSSLFPKFKITYDEYQMVKKYTTLFTNFAYTGNPTAFESYTLDGADWIPFTMENIKYMDIGKKLKMRENLFRERYSVWEKLFPLSDYY